MKPADNQPVEGLHLYGDVFVKSHVVPDEGTILPQHAHTYAHMSFIATGGVRVLRDGEWLGDFKAPCHVEIPARVKHLFQTTAPMTTILCIHNAAHGEAADIHEEHHLVAED